MRVFKIICKWNEVQGDGPSPSGTYGLSINDHGGMAGNYQDNHGFVRDSRGHFTAFDVPDASITRAASINNRGDVTGSVFSQLKNRAFIRSR